MKIAICFFGKHDNKGGFENFYEGYKNINEQILKYNPDIFIHSWKSKYENDVKKEYKITKGVFENQKFKKESNKEKFIKLSMYYSIKTSIGLKNEYEIKNNFKYDCVILTRFDVGSRARFIKFNINDDMNFLYFSTERWKGKGMCDHWVYSNSNNINIFSELLNNLDNYVKDQNYIQYCNGDVFNNHFLYKWHLISNNMVDKICYKYKEYKMKEMRRNINWMNVIEKNLKIKLKKKEKVKNNQTILFNDYYSYYYHIYLTKFKTTSEQIP